MKKQAFGLLRVMIFITVLIKQNMQKRDEVISHLDYVIKYAVRATIDFPSTKQYFDVKLIKLKKSQILKKCYDV